MSVIRLFLRNTSISYIKIRATKNHLHYLKNVMRLKQGEEVFIFNGVDGEWSAVLDGDFLVPQHKLLEQTKLDYKIALCFAIPKAPALKNIVRQCTELGIDIMQPIYTRYTENRLSKLDKVELWAAEAAEQCGRITIPEILEPIQFNEVFVRYSNIFICNKTDCITNFMQMPALDNYTLIIGPEGGFAPEELKRECMKISLAENILRCDTAAACAVSCFKMHIAHFRLISKL